MTVQELAVKFLESKNCEVFLEGDGGFHLMTPDGYRIGLMNNGCIEDPDNQLQYLIQDDRRNKTTRDG